MEKKEVLNIRDRTIRCTGLDGHTTCFHRNLGIWTEGNISTLLFKINEKTNKNYTIAIKLNSLSHQKK